MVTVDCLSIHQMCPQYDVLDVFDDDEVQLTTPEP